MNSLRDDGSWPIDTNLATWNTTLSVNALATATGSVGALGCLDWLLGCQQVEVHPFTNAAPGGWGWSDSSGAVPDVDDTSGALLALAALWSSTPPAKHDRILSAAAAGMRWLLEIQNTDGGWPTFCRGWGKLPFDRSGADLTAHALRALQAWRDRVPEAPVGSAVERGLDYLAKCQQTDGSWTPLWFGNQHHPREENPVYGTARVLLAYRDLGRLDDAPARRGMAWLGASRCPEGSWGGNADTQGNGQPGGHPTVEETAVALEALLADGPEHWDPAAVEQGVGWLSRAVVERRYRETAPIGFYFARLWYYEKLYPLIFSVAALGHAVRHLDPAKESHRTTPFPRAIEPAG
jgi:squalene-hopene/tetraprenyl-beta-curcumene cyclase